MNRKEKRLEMVRKLHAVRYLAIAALAVPTTLVVLIPGTANAGGAPKLVCTSLSGTITAQTISGCTGDGSNFTTATAASTATGSTFTWTSSVGTDKASVTDKTSTGAKDKCPTLSGWTSTLEAKEKGKILSGTGTGTALVGGKTKATACVYSNATTTKVTLF